MAKVSIFLNGILIFLIFFHLVSIHQVSAQATGQPLLVPGQILGLRHNMNQELISPNNHMVFFSAPPGAPVMRMFGGDFGAPLHRGYEWWMVRDVPTADPNSFRLPPGVVLGLRHSRNQAKEMIAVFGRDPISGPNHFSGFSKQFGGDLEAGSGHGYFWYESTGEGFSDWNSVERLPKWIVLGLKHSKNQRDKVFNWNGRKYDPANPNIAPPTGFQRVFGGDRGGKTGEGYYWYEKITGPEVVVIPNLTVRLSRSLFAGASDLQNADLDRDGLLDMLEGELAMIFSPHLIFDSDEGARKPHEPVVLFQVHPVILTGTEKRIGIKWVFLFERDGGYGPNSKCRDAHAGDNDDAYYELITRDNGLTWTVYAIVKSDLIWPRTSRLEVDELFHPIIYMSAHKHHMYFTKDWDHKNSKYSKYGCNDDVNGQGSRVRANVISFRGVNPQIFYNNVGELEHHPSPPFVNDLSKFYPGHSAWGNKNFYDCPPTSSKWMPQWLPTALWGGGRGGEHAGQPPKRMK